MEALCRLIATPGTAGQVYNIGNDEEVSINGLAARILELTGSDSPIVHVPYAEAFSQGFEDMFRRVPSLDKLEQTIGFRPRTPLNQIIGDVIAERRSTADDDAAHAA